MAEASVRFRLGPDMLKNVVLFTINGEPWRLLGVSFAASGILTVLWLSMLTVLLWRHGKSRSLSASEAARVAMHPAESSYVDETVTTHGPAMGKEWEVSMSIGDLRQAWRERDYFRFFGLPVTNLTAVAAFGTFTFAASVSTKSWIPFGGTCIILVPMALIFLFMPWAAVYTKLE